MQITISTPARKELSTVMVKDASFLDKVAQQQGYWIDVEGYDPESLRTIGEKFNIDALTLEDIAVGKQRIKIEEYQDYIFAVSKGVAGLPETQFEYHVDEIFLILSERNILTFHKGPSAVISHTKDALENRVRTLKKESLFASLVVHLIFDFSVDSFYTTLSDVENWLVSIRTEVLDFDSLKASALTNVKGLMSLISRARREMSELRIMLSQHRDVVSLAERGTLKYLSVDLMSDFRDVYDHTFQLIETVDSYMLRTGDVRDLYFTMRAAFTDNILRLLTVVATIFLPLTFLTGFYGMNFTAGFYQPGTSNLYGFYALVVAMVAMSAVLLILFRRRGWV